MPGVYLLFSGLMDAKENGGENRKKMLIHILLYSCAGLFIALAAKIRVTSLFLFLALLIFLAWQRRGRALLTVFFSTLFGMLLFLSAWRGIVSFHVPYDTTDSSITVTHFLMMGESDDGTYNSKDVKYTQGFPTHEEKAANTLHTYLKRLKKNGIFGNLKLMLTKEAIVWGVGTKGHYSYTKYVVDETLCYRLITGDLSDFFRGCMQACNLILFFFIGLGLFCQKEQDGYMWLLSIYLSGCIVFYLFWEANIRHTISFLIFLTFLSIPFVEKLFAEKGD